MLDFIPEEYELLCPTCQRSFVANHLNRRYCSPACKVWANNRKARRKRLDTRHVNTALLKNRDILRGYADGQVVMKDDLLRQGFDVNYQTSQVVQNSVPYFICFDVGFALVDSARTKVKIKFL